MTSTSGGDGDTADASTSSTAGADSTSGGSETTADTTTGTLDPICAELVGSWGEWVSIVVRNVGAQPIYFDTTQTACAVSGPLLIDISDAGGSIPWIETDVSCSPCSLEILHPDSVLAGGCYCAGVQCIPESGVLKLDPGATWTASWQQAYVTNVELPTPCSPDDCVDSDLDVLCAHREAVPEGDYTATLVPAGTAPACVVPGCDCEAAGDTCTIPAPEVTGIEGRPIVGSIVFPVPAPAEVVIEVG